MTDIQTEIDEAMATSCAHCTASGDNFDSDEYPAQYCDDCGQNICHKCWHVQYPGVYCLVCDSTEVQS